MRKEVTRLIPDKYKGSILCIEQESDGYWWIYLKDRLQGGEWSLQNYLYMAHISHLIIREKTMQGAVDALIRHAIPKPYPPIPDEGNIYLVEYGIGGDPDEITDWKLAGMIRAEREMPAAYEAAHRIGTNSIIYRVTELLDDGKRSSEIRYFHFHDFQ